MSKNTMNLFGKTVLTGSLLASVSMVQAEGPFDASANVALTTDYVYRGFTQTDDGIAIQGGFDLEHETGFYIGTWGSNVKFLENNTVKPEDRADIEIDLYGGYRGKLNKQFSYDLKAGHYMYPGAGSHLNYDTNEFNVTFTYNMPQGTEVSVLYDYSPDFFGRDDSHHYKLALNHTLASSLSFGGHVGKQFLTDNKAAGYDDFIYYGLSLSYPIADFDVSVDYSNTDLDNADNFGADDRVFLTLSKTL